MNKSAITKTLLWVSAGVLLGYLAWWVTPAYFKAEEDPRSRESLSKVAAEINRSVPFMIDKETELLPSVGVDGMLIYNYRLINFSTAKLDRTKFAAAAKQQVTQGACSAPETRDGLLKQGVTLRYSYYDKDKKHIASVDVKLADCGS